MPPRRSTITLNIELSPQEEAWLAAQSARQGVSADEVIKRMIDTQLPSTVMQETTQRPSQAELDAEKAAAIALLDAWIAEGAGADEETRRQAEQELDEFKRNMNANRAATGERLVYP